MAVVTGAARGLGALLARSLADRGMKVALLGLEPAELAETAAACGRDARHWEADVTDDAALARVAAEIKAVYGRIDIVIANAGIATGGPVEYSD
ncbi:SDR family NAD(P)-dependent oxidoreductase, partial [Micromonospora aurantiaca]|nr:SDR family NAD(P)-dependent oxidoreductase [Micromonospora aurantiaca]